MRPRLRPAPGRVFILVLDRKDRFLRWVSVDYANQALARGEVERTEHEGTVRVCDGGWNRLNGHGKPMTAEDAHKAKQ